MSQRMERLERMDKRTTLIKIALVSVAALALIGMLYRLGSQAVISLQKFNRSIQVVEYGTMEDKLAGQAAVLNKEDLFIAQEQGRFENLVKDNDKISKGTLLGYYLASQGKTPIRASQAGVFVRTTDGLEEVFQNINLEAVTPEVFQYKPTTIFAEKPLQAGQPIYKIIDSLVPTRLLVTMPADDIDFAIQSKQRVKVLYNGQLLDNGYISDMKPDSKNLLMVVQLDNFNDSLINQRYIKVEILFRSQDGFLVPDKAILEKDGKKGVYCSIGEITRFKPVEILRQKEGISLVNGLDKNDFIVTNPTDKI